MALYIVFLVLTLPMQTRKFSSYLCEDIEKCKSKMWGEEDSNKKVHAVAWDKVCKPKCNGGLGIIETEQNKQISQLESYQRTTGFMGASLT